MPLPRPRSCWPLPRVCSPLRAPSPVGLTRARRRPHSCHCPTESISRGRLAAEVPSNSGTGLRQSPEASSRSALVHQGNLLPPRSRERLSPAPGATSRPVANPRLKDRRRRQLRLLLPRSGRRQRPRQSLDLQGALVEGGAEPVHPLLPCWRIQVRPLSYGKAICTGELGPDPHGLARDRDRGPGRASFPSSVEPVPIASPSLNLRRASQACRGVWPGHSCVVPT